MAGSAVHVEGARFDLTVAVCTSVRAMCISVIASTGAPSTTPYRAACRLCLDGLVASSVICSLQAIRYPPCHTQASQPFLRAGKRDNPPAPKFDRLERPLAYVALANPPWLSRDLIAQQVLAIHPLPGDGRSVDAGLSPIYPGSRLTFGCRDPF